MQCRNSSTALMVHIALKRCQINKSWFDYQWGRSRYTLLMRPNKAETVFNRNLCKNLVNNSIFYLDMHKKRDSITCRYKTILHVITNLTFNQNLPLLSFYISNEQKRSEITKSMDGNKEQFFPVVKQLKNMEEV